jgi:hypothetical protein
MTTLRPYDQHRKVEILGEMWKATKKDHTLRVQVRTHPMGWELRAFVGLDMHRSAVAKTESETLTTSDQWKAEALEKGWSLALRLRFKIRGFEAPGSRDLQLNVRAAVGDSRLPWRCATECRVAGADDGSRSLPRDCFSGRGHCGDNTLPAVSTRPATGSCTIRSCA